MTLGVCFTPCGIGAWLFCRCEPWGRPTVRGKTFGRASVVQSFERAALGGIDVPELRQIGQLPANCRTVRRSLDAPVAALQMNRRGRDGNRFPDAGGQLSAPIISPCWV